MSSATDVIGALKVKVILNCLSLFLFTSQWNCKTSYSLTSEIKNQVLRIFQYATELFFQKKNINSTIGTQRRHKTASESTRTGTDCKWNAHTSFIPENIYQYDVIRIQNIFTTVGEPIKRFRSGLIFSDHKNSILSMTNMNPFSPFIR